MASFMSSLLQLEHSIMRMKKLKQQAKLVEQAEVELKEQAMLIPSYSIQLRPLHLQGFIHLGMLLLSS